jgi:hypothetical protein
MLWIEFLSFWEWLVFKGGQGEIKLPQDIYEEITAGTDNLCDWLKDSQHRDALLLDEEVDLQIVQRVLSQGYSPRLSDTDILKVGRDPFLIATAMVSPDARIVVTTEVSRPSAIGANRRVPDVCRTMGVLCVTPFQMQATLNFSTGWRGVA